ncbi:hypothetical protein BDL97_05G122100 [Sphagnum fallax]|nr:hypothetical protein BDL97_05G122100 [Sphagnum fallax]
MTRFTCYYTRSHQNSEVKRLWARIVLGWVTSREVPVLHPLLPGGVVRILFRTMNVSLFTKDIIVHIELGLHTCFLQVIL